MPRISDRLSATRAQQFVGRQEEQAVFTRALQSAELPFCVLYISGPGGVGKTALLRMLTSICEQHHVVFFHLDARNIERTPQGFADGLRNTLALPADQDPVAFLSTPGSGASPRRVLFIDTYELMESLDNWMREAFLPQLSDNILVVIAGRQPPAMAWRSDSAWQSLLHPLALRNLSSRESLSYLTNRFIPPSEHEAALRFTHGYPLALSLIADVYTQKGAMSSKSSEEIPLSNRSYSASLASEVAPELVQGLLERFIDNVPSPHHRTALEICALVRVTDEALLTEIFAAGAGSDLLPDDYKTGEGPALFQWLRGLSFVEAGRHGIFPHDIVREVLLADLRWRNKERYKELHRLVREYYAKHLPRAQGPEQQRLLYDCIFLHHDNEIIRAAFTWQESGSVFPDSLRDSDHAALLTMLARYEGKEACRIAESWFIRQPEATIVFRDWNEATGKGEVPEPVGFLMMLSLEAIDPAERATERSADPAIDAVYRYLEEEADPPPGPGEGIRYLRFWMARDTYQDISPVQTLVVVQALRHFLTSSVRVAFTFFACRAADFWEPVLRYAEIERIKSADFCLCGSDTEKESSRGDFGVYGQDWRKLPTTEWLARLASKATAAAGPEGSTASEPAPPLPSPPRPTATLSEKDFAAAVRDALRGYASPVALSKNPLLRSRVIASLSEADTADTETRVSLLRSLLHEMVESLGRSPRTTRSYRAVYHTYIEPAPTQEQAAELLDLPQSTYRRHLLAGIHNIQQLLWLKETSSSTSDS